MNKVIILGHLGQDPELRYTKEGTPVCSLSVATSQDWKDKSGEKQSQTEWHRIVVYNKQAEACAKHLLKGRQVLAEGKLHYQSWTDKNNQKRTTTEVIAEKVTFLSHDSGADIEPF